MTRQSDLLDEIERAVKAIDALCGKTKNYELQNAVRQHLQVILASADVLAQ